MDTDLQTLQSHLKKTLEHLKAQFSTLQTGRAHSALVEHVLLEAYGQMQPLKAVASISVQDARTLVIQPWDKSILSAVEKALLKANLGATPVNEGAQIRIVLPSMTEERRKDLVKVVKELAEEARIAIRQQRQEVHSNAKKDDSRTEDQHRDFERQVQKVVDATNAEIESLAEHKEKEVMMV